MNDRYEHRVRALDILSQQHRQRQRRSDSNSHAQTYSGAKRSHIHDETMIAANNSNTKNSLPLVPLIGVVLVVNSLRLLESAAAIRLHHRQQQAVSSPSSSSHSSSSSHGVDRGMLDRMDSMEATEVLTDIQSITDPTRELMLPLDVEDEAAFYYNDKL